MTGAEFAALIRTEMLIEDRDTSKGGSGETPEEFKERVGRLPVYVQERLLVAAVTGASLEEIMEVEELLDAERCGDEGSASHDSVSALVAGHGDG
jgi:hypothetical protein